MGVSIAHVCGRGRGGSAQLVTLHCDDADCRRSVACWSREAYHEQLALGWSVDTSTVVGRTVKCPDHSGVEPTVDVQQELAL